MRAEPPPSPDGPAASLQAPALRHGLFLRGAGALPFGRQTRSVLAPLQWLLGEIRGPVVPLATATVIP